MTYLVYDGSWNGLMTAVFEYYEYKLCDVSILAEKSFQPSLLGNEKTVITDINKASRVLASLSKKLSSNGFGKLFPVFLSEQHGIEDQLLNFIKLVFSSDKSPEQAYGNTCVLTIDKVAKMVHREKHRMEAFIRFQQLADGLYYAHISPDFNVLPLIAKHFKNRYADQQWLIYDLKRKYGIYYDLSDVQEVTLDISESPTEGSIFHEDEVLYQTLWKDYFQSVNIKPRKNSKLHIRHVPKRYWKYLTEKLPA
ncbi:DUF4130 domain-containing protein [Pedobacter sp. HMF7647]|uniref:DUF4130 domain-containing protein n=1 Tax=Hufsiella arboris TaxID=2695275 RepID=A0A7K1Y7X4_9SPHI|nr:TIGR03915 family putative DNA repair protein [Hufsiella arboris]MXV50685.1 DUF4130 domain-containing protein [Hufsiella arboris]